jgi:hypothetical protein
LDGVAEIVQASDGALDVSEIGPTTAVVGAEHVEARAMRIQNFHLPLPLCANPAWDAIRRTLEVTLPSRCRLWRTRGCSGVPGPD